MELPPQPDPRDFFTRDDMSLVEMHTAKGLFQLALQAWERICKAVIDEGIHEL